MILQKIYKILIIPYSLFLLYLMFFGFGRVSMENQVFRFVPIYSTYDFLKNQLFFRNYYSVYTLIVWLFENVNIYKLIKAV